MTDPLDSGDYYNDLSLEYDNLWLGHRKNARHEADVRSSWWKFSNLLQKDGVALEGGAIIVAGPGYNVADNGNFDRASVENFLGRFAHIIPADFSTGALLNATRSMEDTARVVRGKIRLARTDFSGGISTKFEHQVEDRIDRMNTPQDVEEFLTWLDQEARPEKIAAMPLGAGSSDAGNPESASIHMAHGLDLRQITNQTADVRVIISSLLLAGMFAVQEAQFREQLFAIAERHPAEMNKDELKYALMRWHVCINELNLYVTNNFLSQAAQFYPKAHHLHIVDIDSHYSEYDVHPRLDMGALRKRVTALKMDMTVIKVWTADDSGETPSHTHTMNAIKLHLPEKKTESKPPEDKNGGEQGKPVR